ncbi:MAG: lipopolysaccharide biosynthesis protein RfbH [Sedimentisphaerales bacterium]|nr:lipopolysaccharide biosynthesis protein RfbH [Sedimentisphaerales bacterium]
MIYKTGDILAVNTDTSGTQAGKLVVLIESLCDDELLVAILADEVDDHKTETSSVPISQDDVEEGSLNAAGTVNLHKLTTTTAKLCKRVATLKHPKKDELLRKFVAMSTEVYYRNILNEEDTFVPCKSSVPYGGRIYNEKELVNLVDSSLDFWLTAGRYAEKFENDFSEIFGVKYCSLTNSGSSANLLAFMALTSPKLADRQIKKGDEVITVAAGFPTTITPIVQYGAVPVFVDVTLPTYNIDCSQLDSAISPLTRAVMLAHTLGNPFDLQKVKNFCDKNNLWLIEDNCDALGSRYRLDGRWEYTGTVGDIGTSSFYPPHHITMGEGGAVYTDNTELKRIVDSFRDWGRDCWCPPGKDNTCQKRFSRQMGELPKGYDHKYIYSHFGYNLKITDMQAAIGCAQLKKLQNFIELRKENWKYLNDGLKELEDVFILPRATDNSDPSWFGFLLTVRDTSPFTRDEIVRHLEDHGVQTRMLFAGNLTKHPCFDEMRENNEGYRTIGKLQNTDRIMNQTFWLGVYPGMTKIMLDHVIRQIKDFVHQTTGSKGS